MPKVDTVKVKVFDSSPASSFISSRKSMTSFGRIMGIDLSGNIATISRRDVVMQGVALTTLFAFSCFVLTQMYVEHRAGNGILLMDLFTINSAFTCCVMMFQLWLVYHHQLTLRSLLNRCESFYHPAADSNWISKSFEEVKGPIPRLIGILLKMSYFNPIFLAIPCIIVLVVKQEPMFALPLYRDYTWSHRLHWGLILNVFLTMMCIYYNRVVFFTLSLFTNLTHHISGQFKYLSFAVRTLSSEVFQEQQVPSLQFSRKTDHTPGLQLASKKLKGAFGASKFNGSTRNVLNVSEKLRSIGWRHNELLQMVMDVDSVFTKILLASELFCIIGIPMIGFSLFIDGDIVTLGLGTLFVLVFMMSYSLLGQQIINSANEFGGATYEGDWLQLSPKDRKQLVLIMLMAGKPVGTQSGGFHYVNHLQLTQTISRGYNLMLCIVKVSNKV